jgi:hypothetical protein
LLRRKAVRDPDRVGKEFVMSEIPTTRTPRVKRWVGGAALLAGGLVAGGALTGALTASADPTPSPGTSGYAAPNAGGQGAPVDESKSQRPDEKLLTGDTADKVKAAALAKYPGATIQRVETDSDGVYEAHLTTSAGERVTVEVGKDFAVTGNEAAPGHR